MMGCCNPVLDPKLGSSVQVTTSFCRVVIVSGPDNLQTRVIIRDTLNNGFNIKIIDNIENAEINNTINDIIDATINGTIDKTDKISEISDNIDNIPNEPSNIFQDHKVYLPNIILHRSVSRTIVLLGPLPSPGQAVGMLPPHLLHPPLPPHHHLVWSVNHPVYYLVRGHCWRKKSRLITWLVVFLETREPYKLPR